jgi:hypothetical protein
VYPPSKLSASQLALFWRFYNPSICKPKSTIEERNKTPVCFRMATRIATLRLSYLFVYIANRITAPFHSQALLIRLRQDADFPYELGDLIMIKEYACVAN